MSQTNLYQTDESNVSAVDSISISKRKGEGTNFKNGSI